MSEHRFTFMFKGFDEEDKVIEVEGVPFEDRLYGHFRFLRPTNRISTESCGFAISLEEDAAIINLLVPKSLWKKVKDTVDQNVLAEQYEEVADSIIQFFNSLSYFTDYPGCKPKEQYFPPGENVEANFSEYSDEVSDIFDLLIGLRLENLHLALTRSARTLFCRREGVSNSAKGSIDYAKTASLNSGLAHRFFTRSVALDYSHPCLSAIALFVDEIRAKIRLNKRNASNLSKCQEICDSWLSDSRPSYQDIVRVANQDVVLPPDLEEIQKFAPWCASMILDINEAFSRKSNDAPRLSGKLFNLNKVLERILIFSRLSAGAELLANAGSRNALFSGMDHASSITEAKFTYLSYDNLPDCVELIRESKEIVVYDAKHFDDPGRDEFYKLTQNCNQIDLLFDETMDGNVLENPSFYRVSRAVLFVLAREADCELLAQTELFGASEGTLVQYGGHFPNVVVIRFNFPKFLDLYRDHVFSNNTDSLFHKLGTEISKEVSINTGGQPNYPSKKVRELLDSIQATLIELKALTDETEEFEFPSSAQELNRILKTFKKSS
ncbi:MAG TPA: hypothetical protein VE954_38165 [Oligoflexus sp.]|uniref:hypothetical protein n=1 Tax=Oligoflexus sp. TaxID=1971216 RepID=UPI002D2DB201|nr:hypothetical protein [Oligoflexus sp.]HYX38965.1 hypothetical protein [Oligoflexus sp.]